MMELDDCSFPLLAGMIGTDDPNVAFKDAQFALLVGARPRGPGMERKDLLTENAKIFTVQGEAIGKHADPNIKVLVVGNPCNTNAYIAMKTAEKFGRVKARNFTAMLRLDHMHDWHLGSKGEWVTMGVPSDGSYGIPAGVVYGFPCTTDGGDYKIVQGLEIDTLSKEKMANTLKELEEERAGVASLLG